MQFHGPFFKEETLAEVRFRHVPQIGNPDFLGFVQDSLAAKKPLDFSQMAGITYRRYRYIVGRLFRGHRFGLLAVARMC